MFFALTNIVLCRMDLEDGFSREKTMGGEIRI